MLYATCTKSVSQEVCQVPKVYADLIRKGLKTIDDVPEVIRDEVRRLLEDE